MPAAQVLFDFSELLKFERCDCLIVNASRGSNIEKLPKRRIEITCFFQVIADIPNICDVFPKGVIANDP